MTLKDRLTCVGSKRILSLDGGGIRGVITLGFLERVENELRQQHGQPALLLSDYFDLIIGTSTGAIIAGALAKGMSVAEITHAYLELGGKVFQKTTKIDPRRWLKATFDATKLDSELTKVFGEITLGSSDLRTGICVVTKRIDTGSTWVNINHPDDKYFPQKSGILLRKIIRASTAAPTYFEPEILDVGYGEKAAFIDGGMSMANNPSLQALMMVMLKGFPYRWKTGADSLYMLSVGTGTWEDRKVVHEAIDRRHDYWALEIPSMLMNDASILNQLLLQVTSKCLNPVQIDQQIGTAAGELVGDNPLLTYVRYDARLEVNALNAIHRSDLVLKLDSLRDMSDAANRADLLDIGKKVAADVVKLEHFPKQFMI